MPIAIVRKKVARPMVGYKDIDAKTTYAPFQIDLRNGRMDVLGNWIGRSGYGDSIDTGVDLPIHKLIPEENGIAILTNGQVFRDVLGSPNEIADSGLAGIYRPSVVKYGDKILIAEGGQIVKIENQIALTISGSPDNVRFLGRMGSYTMWAKYNSSEFGWSAVSNPESYPAANFATVKLTGKIYHATDHNDFWYMFKDNNIEVWNNVGGDAPIRRLKSVSIWGAGTKSADGVVKANGTLYWPDTDGDFKVLPGEVISGSHRAYFDDKITREDWGLCHGYDCRKENSIRFIFPLSGICIVYDYKENRIYEDNKWFGSDWQRLPWNSYMEMNNKQYFGDYGNTGLVYTWGDDYKTDNGQPIRTFREAKVLIAEGLRARVTKIELQMKRGVATESIENPVMTFRTRMNGSSRWNERVIDLGVKGDNAPIKTLTNFGIGTEITYQLISTDAVDNLIEEIWITAIPMVR